jgi:hypothetical protein
MARIKCRTPSTGKPIRIILKNVPNVYTRVVDAPDFSIPDPSDKFEVRDPLDPTRAIRPGEIFFLSPISAINKSELDQWIEVKLVTESNEDILFAKLLVPAGDTALIPIQGRSIFKRDPNAAIGDSLDIRAENNNVFDIWIAGEEKVAPDHVGVEPYGVEP